MFDYVYTDHAQYTIKTYAKMALFPLLLTGPLSLVLLYHATHAYTHHVTETCKDPWGPLGGIREIRQKWVFVRGGD